MLRRITPGAFFFAFSSVSFIFRLYNFNESCKMFLMENVQNLFLTDNGISDAHNYDMEDFMDKQKIQVELAEYKGVTVARRQAEVTEQEVLAELERARSYASITKDKDDGQAAMGDQAVIDFVGYIDDEPFEGGDGTDYPLVLGSNTFIPGFEEQLVGARVGDQVDVKVPFPTNYHAKEYAGRDAVFKVTIKSLRATITPELSDEVVAKISPCKTIDEFKVYVENEIRKYKEDQLLQEKENEVLTKIVEASRLEIPEEMIKGRAQILKNSLEGQLRNSGNTLQDYMDYNNLSPEMLDEYLTHDAVNMLKGQAVLLEIAKKEGMAFTQEELDEELFNMARGYQTTVGELQKMLGDEGVEMVGNDLLHKKALDFIVAESVEV